MITNSFYLKNIIFCLKQKHNANLKALKPVKLDTEVRCHLFSKKTSFHIFILSEEYVFKCHKYDYHLQEQAKIAKLGLELHLLTSDLDSETEKWEDQENEIVQHGQGMSSMAYSMYLFTRYLHCTWQILVGKRALTVFIRKKKTHFQSIITGTHLERNLILSVGFINFCKFLSCLKTS